MKIKLYILFNLFIIISCKSQEKTQNISEKDRIEDCEKFWTNRFPNDTLRVEFINKIISENKEKLTNNNLGFLTSLKLFNQSDLAINNVLFPTLGRPTSATTGFVILLLKRFPAPEGTAFAVISAWG